MAENAGLAPSPAEVPVTSGLAAAARLFEEHFDHLAALVRRRLEVGWRFGTQKHLASLEAELLEYAREFGLLLKVAYRYQLFSALQEEAGWYLSLLSSRGPGAAAADLLLDSWLVAIHGVIKPPECHLLAAPLVQLRSELEAWRRRPQPPAPSSGPDVSRLLEVLVTGDLAAARELVAGWLAQGCPPEEIIPSRLLGAMGEIGRLWEKNELRIYQEHLATETLIRLLSGFPLLVGAPLGQGPRALVSCAPGDEHQVVTLALSVYLEMRGWQVRNLGRSLPGEEIAAAAMALRPEAVFMSLTLLSRLEEALATVRRLHSLEPRPVVVLGGRGAGAARHLLAEAGGRVVQDFAAAHQVALEELRHA